MKPNFRLTFLMAIFLLLSLSVKASWNSFVDNFNNEDYGRGTTTWRISTVGRWGFFANQNGVLVYDGFSWQHFYLNNRSEAKSVAVLKSKGRIYVGGENEFGYLEPIETGELKYHCLSEKLGREYRSIGNVFDIYEADGIIYYRCDNYILISNDGKYRMVKSPHKIFSSVMVDMVLYLATDEGVFTLMGNKLVPINNGAILCGKRINSIIRFGKGILVSTFSDGLYYYDGKDLMPYHTVADELLKHAGICYAASKGDLLAFGTMHDGLVLLNVKTGTVTTYGEFNGLQHNTVISVAFDERGNVWAGLDSGIDYVNLTSPFSYLYKSPFSYGIGNAVAYKDGLLYMATDRGLYCSSFPVDFTNGLAHVKKIDVPSGIAWNLYRFGDELLCLHDKGLFSIQGLHVTKIASLMGVWSCAKVQGHANRLFIGVYEGFYILEKSLDGWRVIGKIKGIKQSGRYFRQIGNQRLKVYNPKLGKAVIYDLDKSLLNVVKSKEIKEDFPNQLDDALKDINVERNTYEDNTINIGKHLSIVPCNLGYLLYDKSAADLKGQNVFIRRIVTTSLVDSTVYMPNFMHTEHKPVIPYSTNSIRIEYGVSEHQMLSVKYRYRLNGSAWSEYQDVTSKEYSNLFEGKYCFEVMACLSNGKTFTDKVEFTILPPWYRTVWAYLIYILLFGVFVWQSLRFENRKIERKKELAVMQKDKEMDQMKVEIDKLEKEKLDLDLKHKSQEIADLMISMKRKNEILIDIKQKLTVAMNQLKGNNPKMTIQQLVLINSNIDTNIEGDEILKKFEEQFDVVNDMFMGKLSKQYPSLNQNERLMCAYLRMNFSTKEMAPLLNISVRGVETMRYRLRKKLGLEREDNLIEFLNKV